MQKYDARICLCVSALHALRPSHWLRAVMSSRRAGMRRGGDKSMGATHDLCGSRPFIGFAVDPSHQESAAATITLTVTGTVTSGNDPQDLFRVSDEVNELRPGNPFSVTATFDTTKGVRVTLPDRDALAQSPSTVFGNAAACDRSALPGRARADRRCMLAQAQPPIGVRRNIFAFLPAIGGHLRRCA